MYVFIVNVAVALAQQENENTGRKLRVGLMDGDIYGPSVPMLMQLSGMQAETNNGKLFKKISSFFFLLILQKNKKNKNLN
jgi:Mrp family chromosome partitioning ATPase